MPGTLLVEALAVLRKNEGVPTATTLFEGINTELPKVDVTEIKVVKVAFSIPVLGSVAVPQRVDVVSITTTPLEMVNIESAEVDVTGIAVVQVVPSVPVQGSVVVL